MTGKRKVVALIVTILLILQSQAVLYARVGLGYPEKTNSLIHQKNLYYNIKDKLSVKGKIEKTKSFSYGADTKVAEELLDNSKSQNVLRVLLPELPTNVSAIGKSPDKIELDWSAPFSSVPVTGYKIYRDGILIGSTSRTSFKDTKLEQNTTYLYEIKSVSGNNVESEGGVIFETATPMVISQDTEWNNSNGPYELNGGLIVNKNATLNIGEGVIIKIKPLQSIVVKGEIAATGTEDNMIVITSTYDPDYGGKGIKDWRDYWSRILISEKASFSGNFVKIVYGNKIAYVEGFLGLTDSEVGNANALGISVSKEGQFNGVNVYIHDCCVGELCRGIYTEGLVQLTECEISDCPGTGVEIGKTGTFNGTMVNINNCGKGISNKGILNLITSKINNCQYGIFFDTTEENNIVWNSFISNNTYGVYNNKAKNVIVNASNNYWGSTSGPSVYNSDISAWEGDGDRVGDGVIYEEWLEEPIL